MPNDKGGENVVPMPQKQGPKPKEQISRFGHNFTMYRIDQFGNRKAEPIQLVEDGPAKGYCKVNMVGYAMIPLEEFESWRRRWRAVRMAKRAVKIIRGQLVQKQQQEAAAVAQMRRQCGG